MKYTETKFDPTPEDLALARADLIGRRVEGWLCCCGTLSHPGLS